MGKPVGGKGGKTGQPELRHFSGLCTYCPGDSLRPFSKNGAVQADRLSTTGLICRISAAFKAKCGKLRIGMSNGGFVCAEKGGANWHR